MTDPTKQLLIDLEQAIHDLFQKDDIEPLKKLYNWLNEQEGVEGVSLDEIVEKDIIKKKFPED